MHKALTSAVMVAATLLCAASPPARADGEMKCTLTFTLSGWSAFYKTATGKGTVHCANGESMAVKLRAKGGGPTVGKSTIEDGHGEFSGVVSIKELLGSYIAAEAGAGAGKAVQGQVMTKGEVSLALSGTGRGWDLGISFGKLTISR